MKNFHGTVLSSKTTFVFFYFFNSVRCSSYGGAQFAVHCVRVKKRDELDGKGVRERNTANDGCPIDRLINDSFVYKKKPLIITQIIVINR